MTAQDRELITHATIRSLVDESQRLLKMAEQIQAAAKALAQQHGVPFEPPIYCERCE